MTETSIFGCSEEASTSEPPDEIEYIKVVVRCCSMKDKELAAGQKSIVETDTDQGIVKVTNSILPGSTPVSTKTFTFDVLNMQNDFYDTAVKKIVDGVLQGYNGTVFAYGQTGAGKTTTIQGVKGSHELRGAIPRSCEHIFSHTSQSTNQQYMVYVSYLQIYQEQLMDLLSPDSLHSSLEIKEHPETGVYVKNLTSIAVKNMRELEHLLTVGNRNSERWITHMSMLSSRVTYIFTITVECSEVSDNEAEQQLRVGQLNLVDMAGSERKSRTQEAAEMLKEASKIGLSLSPLGSVICALVDEKSKHVPYRNSKLTRLLKDSLGGSARTVMVGCISPAWSNYDETVSTLRYAHRARNIRNKPKVHVDPKYALLFKYQEEIDRLKAELIDTTNAGGSCGKNNNEDLSCEAITTETTQDVEDKLKLEKGILDTDKAESGIKHGTLDMDELEAKIKGMRSRLLTGGASYGEHQLPLEDGQLVEVLNTDFQRLYIRQNLMGT